jgi:predicted amidohydrolase YtcJ
LAYPHLIIVNGSIRTMDEALPVAEAMAIRGDRIQAVGTNQEVRALAGPRTRVIDAGQGTVLPGFNDAHVHFLAGGFSLGNVDLRPASSPAELAERLAQYAANTPPGHWIQGGDWDHENWISEARRPDGAGNSRAAPLPDRQLIDSGTGRHPVLINRLDGHMALANSVALHLAGITRNTPDPPGGLIVRHSKTGEPTGILKDAAQTLVERVIPPKSFQQKRAAARAASEHAAMLGVTSVTDVSTDDDLPVYEDLRSQGELKTRIYAARSIVSWERLVKTPIAARPAYDLVRTGILKGFSDGSLGSSTALFFEDYCDDPGNRGLLFEQMLPEGIMLERVLAADRHGLQVMIHAIGDEANWRILELFERVARRNGARDRRFRIEHAQHLRESEIPRFGRQKVIGSMQPYHAADDGRWCEQRLGRRCKGAYAFRSLLDSGARLAFGSDWTVAPLNPLLGVKAAVTRQTLDGRRPDGWLPEQKISLTEALRAYTLGSAYAEFAEPQKGSLIPGKLADVIILDRDLYKIDPGEIDQARVRLTLLNRRIAYQAA